MFPKRIRSKLIVLENYEEEFKSVQLTHELSVRKHHEAEERQKQHNLQKQIQHWLELRGIAFEDEIAQLFRRAGYNVHTTPTSGDKGIDLIVEKDNRKIIEQCKAHKVPIGPAVIRELYGTLRSLHDESVLALLITLTGATSGAMKFAKENDIVIWDIGHIIKFNDENG